MNQEVIEIAINTGFNINDVLPIVEELAQPLQDNLKNRIEVTRNVKLF